MKKIYVVDDDKEILKVLAHWFERKNYVVKTFFGSLDFVKSLLTEKPSLIILDINLPGDDGRQLCDLVKVKYDGSLPVILMSGTPELGDDYFAYSADAFLQKPFDLSSLEDIVDQLL